MQLIEREMALNGFAKNPRINVTWVLGFLNRKLLNRFLNSFLNQVGRITIGKWTRIVRGLGLGRLLDGQNQIDGNAYHAIAGFGPDTPSDVIQALVELLLTGDSQNAPAASEALRVIGSPEVLKHLTDAAQSNAGVREWALATIGRLPPDIVRSHLQGTPLLDQLAPMLLVSEGANWLSTEDAMTDMAFLLKQNI